MFIDGLGIEGLGKQHLHAAFRRALSSILNRQRLKSGQDGSVRLEIRNLYINRSGLN